MVMRISILIWLAMLTGAWAQGDARLMILHDHGNPVVSEMVTLTIRGEYDLTVSLEDMQFPDSRDYDWIQIARDDWHKERVNGRLLQIFERKVAIFPRQPGLLTIGPVTHHLTFVTGDEGRETVDVTAPPARVNVKPFPGNHQPLAARRLTLTDELSADPGQLRKDEVLTRRVTIEALGTLSHLLPPRPDLRQPWMISFSQPEQRETIPTPDGPVARVIWEWQLRPHTGEPAILPAETFPWFNTDNRQVEIAAMKPIPFGLAGFGANIGDPGPAPHYLGLIGGAIVAAGSIFALVLLLQGQGFGRKGEVIRRLRRMMPSPHLGAMRRAARENDLPALRALAAAHLRWRGQRETPALAALDRQIFAQNPPRDFDPMRWLRDFHRATVPDAIKAPGSGQTGPARESG
ncbi:MAG: hypothetical protein COB97_05375 [Paracoccus sp.]|nr:MAG: hypothetical protein COB97_05375 [Paracoccus sp. (in: a-proteobacteria)]